MEATKKNDFMNYLKGIACFGVVLVHVKLPNYVLDGVIQSVFRFAIPLFFMVSGYFCDTSDREKLEKRLPKKCKHILGISVIGCVYYFIFNVMIALFGDSHGTVEDVVKRVTSLFEPRKIADWILFNQDPFINIMWFTFALLYCYLLLWVINRFDLYRKMFWSIPVLLGVHMILGNVLILFGVEVSKLYYRNFLFFGLPFLLFGVWLRRNQARVMEKLPVKATAGFMLAGPLLSIAEWFVFGRRELFFGSIVFVLGAFVYALHRPEAKQNSFITVIGEKYSLFVYIVHVSLISVLDRVAYKILPGGAFTLVYEYAKTFLIFGISVVGAYVFYLLVNTWKKRKGNKSA